MLDQATKFVAFQDSIGRVVAMTVQSLFPIMVVHPVLKKFGMTLIHRGHTSGSPEEEEFEEDQSETEGEGLCGTEFWVAQETETGRFTTTTESLQEEN